MLRIVSITILFLLLLSGCANPINQYTANNYHLWGYEAESLSLEKKVSGPISGNISKRLFELARLYFDHKEYEKAVPYYQRGIPILRSFDFEKSDPIAFSNILNEFGEALNKAGKKRDADKNIAEAKQILLRNPDKVANFIPVRYNSNCGANEI